MAAPILAYEDLGLVQDAGWLFRHIDLHLGERDRLALIGRNGAGKTTLLRLIAGQIDSDEGRRYEGAGLGLSFVRRVAHLMGGDVACQSAPGQGSTFTLWVAAQDA